MLTAEQKSVKATGVGSSQVAAIVGLNPWSSPIDVWSLATGRAEFDATRGGGATEVGSLLEPSLVRIYASRQSIDTDRLVQPHSTFRHPQYAFALASPDVLVMDGETPSGIVELKTVGSRMSADWEDGPPQYVAIQVAWQQFVMNVDRAEVAALIDGTDFQIFTVSRDREIEQSLLEIVQEFWSKYVLTDTPPPLSEGESRREYLAKRFRGGRPDLVEVEDAHVVELVERYRAAKADVATADAALEAVECDLKEIIGDTAGLCGSWGKATWNTQHGAPAYKAIATALAPYGVIPPELIEQHRGGSFRKFTVYGPSKKNGRK